MISLWSRSRTLMVGNSSARWKYSESSPQPRFRTWTSWNFEQISLIGLLTERTLVQMPVFMIGRKVFCSGQSRLWYLSL